MNANTWLVVAGGAGFFLMMAWAGVAVRSAWLEKQEDIARRQTLKEEVEQREKEEAEQRKKENLDRAVKSIEQLISGKK